MSEISEPQGQRVVLFTGEGFGNRDIARQLTRLAGFRRYGGEGRIVAGAWKRFWPTCRAAVGPELAAAIKQYIALHNQNLKPFLRLVDRQANDILQNVIRANLRLASKKNEALH